MNHHALRTLLVVDDDHEILEILDGLLAGSQWKVFSTTSTTDAQVLHDNFSIDAALLDANMPEMNGIELLDAFRLNNPDIPVLMMSGAPDDWLSDALTRNCAGFLAKPLRRESLLGALDEALTRR